MVYANNEYRQIGYEEGKIPPYLLTKPESLVESNISKVQGTIVFDNNEGLDVLLLMPDRDGTGPRGGGRRDGSGGGKGNQGSGSGGNRGSSGQGSKTGGRKGGCK